MDKFDTTMKKKKAIILTFMSLLFCLSGYPQESIILTFTAIDSASYVQLDSIKIINRTQICDTMLYWNDTVLVLTVPVGVSDNSNQQKGFKIQGFPNPVINQSRIELALPEEGLSTLTITDVLGRILFILDRELQAGFHDFKFIPGNASIYFITAIWNGHCRTIKLVNESKNKGLQCTISYQGYHAAPAVEKASEALQGFNFEIGDELLYVGYVDTLESGLLSVPSTSQIYTFQFATNIPCPGTPTVEYEGQVYNTIQIFSQCWLKENLNVGTMIQGSENMADNDTIEKYCYNNDPDSCTKYGGLYQWYEMMQYTTQQGAQGICPQGWHLPTDEEWKILEGTVDSQYGVGDPEWDGDDLRGYDAGKNLKTTSGWYSNGNGTDLFGFSGLPGGLRYGYCYFDGVGSYGYWWTSTELNYYYAWSRILDYCYPDLYRYHSFKIFGYSVRCLRD